jgi:hypothetical protein
MKKSMNITTAQMAPAAMVGVYGHSTYSGTESSAGPGVDMFWRRNWSLWQKPVRYRKLRTSNRSTGLENVNSS